MIKGYNMPDERMVYLIQYIEENNGYGEYPLTMAAYDNYDKAVIHIHKIMLALKGKDIPFEYDGFHQEIYLSNNENTITGYSTSQVNRIRIYRQTIIRSNLEFLPQEEEEYIDNLEVEQNF